MTSPYDLVQEMAMREHPHVWRVLVACMLLNKTHGRVVRSVAAELFRRFPTPEAVTTAAPETRQALLELLRPLGLYNRRIKLLTEMSEDYLSSVRLESMRGVGDYAIASVRIFVMRDYDTVTDDPWLTRYLEWVRENHRSNQCTGGARTE